MGTREYEVTRYDRRGNPTVTTQMLSEADAAALGDAAKPVGEQAKAKARRPANKARSTRTK